MIILEPKSEPPNQPTPPNEQPPSYRDSQPVPGRSHPISTSPLPPPPARARPMTERSMPKPLTVQDEILMGEDYRNQLLARCAQGNHESRRHFGVIGILLAVFLFPIGLFCLGVDSERNCSRCGVRLD